MARRARDSTAPNARLERKPGGAFRYRRRRRRPAISRGALDARRRGTRGRDGDSRPRPANRNARSLHQYLARVRRATRPRNTPRPGPSSPRTRRWRCQHSPTRLLAGSVAPGRLACNPARNAFSLAECARASRGAAARPRSATHGRQRAVLGCGVAVPPGHGEDVCPFEARATELGSRHHRRLSAAVLRPRATRLAAARSGPLPRSAARSQPTLRVDARSCSGVGGRGQRPRCADLDRRCAATVAAIAGARGISEGCRLCGGD